MLGILDGVFLLFRVLTPCLMLLGLANCILFTKLKIFCCCKLKHANSTNVSVCIAVGRLVSAFDF